MSTPFRNHDPYDNYTRDSRNNNRNRRHNQITVSGLGGGSVGGGNNHHYHYRDDDIDGGEDSSAVGSRVSQGNRSLASGRSGASAASRSFATYESNSVQQASSLYHGLSHYDPNTGEVYTISDDNNTTASSSNESQSITNRSYEHIHHAMVYGTETGHRKHSRRGSASDGGGSGSSASGSLQYFADVSGNSDHRWIMKGSQSDSNGGSNPSLLQDVGGNGDSGSRVSVSGGNVDQDVISMTSLSIQLSHGSRDPRKYYTPIEDDEDDGLVKIEEDNSQVAAVHGIAVAGGSSKDRDWDASNAFHASDSESCTTESNSMIDLDGAPMGDEQDQARRVALYNMSIVKQRRQRSKQIVCISLVASMCTVAGIIVLTIIFVPRDFQFNSGSSGTGASNPYYGTTTSTNGGAYGGLGPPPYYKDKEDASSSLSIACQLKLFAQEPATQRDLTQPLTLAGQLALNRLLSDAATPEGDSSSPGNTRNGVLLPGTKSPNSFLFELNRTMFEDSMQSCAGHHQTGAKPVTAVAEGRPPRVPYGSTMQDADEEESFTEKEPFPEGQGSGSDVVSSYVSPLSQLVNLDHPNVTMELKLHPGRPPMLFDLSLLKESLTSSSSPSFSASSNDVERKYGVYAKIERLARESSSDSTSSFGVGEPAIGEDIITKNSPKGSSSKDESEVLDFPEPPEINEGAVIDPGRLDPLTPMELDGVEEVNLIMNARGAVTGSAHMGGSIFYISTLEDGSQLVEAVALDSLPPDDAGDPYLEHPSGDEEEDENESGNLRRSLTRDQFMQHRIKPSSFRTSRSLNDVPMPAADVVEKEEAVEAAAEADDLEAEATSYIDVLVPYTSRAFCAIVKAPEELDCEVTDFRLEQVHQRVELMIFESNVALEQSGITGKQFRLANAFLVDTYGENDEVFDEQSNGWGYADLLKMAARATDGWLLDIHNARNAHGGDVVAFLVDHPGQCGLAYGGFPVSEKWAYCVVNYMCATGYYSFAHEVAHLLGARHDRSAERCPLEGLLEENDTLLNGGDQASVNSDGSVISVQSVIADLETTVVPAATADVSFVKSGDGEDDVIGGNNKQRPSPPVSSSNESDETEGQGEEEEFVESLISSEKEDGEKSVGETVESTLSAAEQIANDVEQAMSESDTSSEGSEDESETESGEEGDEPMYIATESSDSTEASISKIGVETIEKLNQSGGCCGSGQNRPCDGFGFQDIWGRYRTVMAYRCPTRNCPRIQMFSQPEHDYEVKFTTWVVLEEEEDEGETIEDQSRGADEMETSGTNYPTKYVPVTNIYKYKVGHELYNNARQIVSTWDIVANYRQPPKPRDELEGSILDSAEISETLASDEDETEVGNAGVDDPDEGTENEKASDGDDEDPDESDTDGGFVDDGNGQRLDVPEPVLSDPFVNEWSSLEGASVVSKEVDMVEARGNQNR